MSESIQWWGKVSISGFWNNGLHFVLQLDPLKILVWISICRVPEKGIYPQNCNILNFVMYYCSFSIFKAIKKFWKAKQKKFHLIKFQKNKSLIPCLYVITNKCLTYVSPVTHKGLRQTVWTNNLCHFRRIWHQANP
jgi:hypothetical protein